MLIFITIKKGVKRTDAPLYYDRSTIGKIVLLSLFTAGALYFSVLAIDLVGPVSYATTDVVFYAAYVAVISYVLIGERISRSTAIATVISIVGFLVFYFGQGYDLAHLQFSGTIAASASSLFYAFSLVLIKDLLTRGVPPDHLVLYRFLLLGMLSVIILPRTIAALPLAVIVSIVLLGVFGYAMLFVIFFYGLRNVPATLVSVFVASSPLFTAFFTWLIIPETTFVVSQGVGLAIILTGLLYAIYEEKPQIA
jgi:drug/metabolite transporter (DMT)-like permease